MYILAQVWAPGIELLLPAVGINLLNPVSDNFNISKAICKQPCINCAPTMVPEIEYCFDKLEDTFVLNTSFFTNESQNIVPTSSFLENMGNEDMYCYPDSSLSISKKCDVIEFENGTRMEVNCWIVDDLVMYYNCINVSEANVTKGVWVQGTDWWDR